MKLYNRKSIRLKDYDYSQKWMYFITISVNNRLCLFWEIKNWNMKMYDSWKMISDSRFELEEKYANIKLHGFVLMPNHIHWIIEIVNQYRRGEPCVRPDNGNDCSNIGVNTRFTRTDNNGNDCSNIGVNTRFTPTGGKFVYDKNSISSIIQSFKSITTNKYIKNVQNKWWFPFYEKLWQRNYYEHIIRNTDSYLKISNYIKNNPQKWDEDKFYYTEF